MSIQVSEEMVDILRSRSVPVPLADIEGEQGLICMCSRDGDELLQVRVEVGNEILVEVLSKEVCYKMSALRTPRNMYRTHLRDVLPQ